MTNLNDIKFRRSILIKNYIHKDDNNNNFQRFKVEKEVE
jgi:hypothetical protein